MITAGPGSLLIASFLGANSDYYLPSAWQKTYIVMALFQSIGFLACLLSPEPKIKRKLISQNNEALKLTFIFVLFISFFGLIFLNYPRINFENIFFKSVFGLSKFIICLILSSSIFFVFIKIKFLNKKMSLLFFGNLLRALIKNMVRFLYI